MAEHALSTPFEAAFQRNWRRERKQALNRYQRPIDLRWEAGARYVSELRKRSAARL
jgi:hypothetical protein